MGRKKNNTSSLKDWEKARDPIAQRLNALIVNPRELSEHLGCTIQAVNQYRQGLSRPSLENICKIADFYGVTTDYILRGISSDNVDVHRATGLSEDSINLLSLLSKSPAYTRPVRQSIINHILVSDIFWRRIIVHLESAWKCRKGISNIDHPDKAAKAKELAEMLKALNLGNVTDYVVFTGKSAADVQIQYATKATEELFRSIIEDILEGEIDNNG